MSYRLPRVWGARGGDGGGGVSVEGREGGEDRQRGGRRSRGSVGRWLGGCGSSLGEGEGSGGGRECGFGG